MEQEVLMNMIYMGYICNVYAYLFKIYYSLNNMSYENFQKLNDYINKNDKDFIPEPNTMSIFACLIPYLSYYSSFFYYNQLQTFFKLNPKLRFVDFLIMKRFFPRK